MIYDVNGNQINTVYDVSGNALQQAYDIDGNPLIDTEQITLTVMSYNIGQWYIGANTNVPASKYSAYYAMQRKIFSDNQPDIACLQEYYDPFSEGHPVSEVFGDYYTNIYNSGSSYAKKATMTNGYPVSNYQQITYATGGQVYTKGTIVVGGKTVWIINTHLATSSNESMKVSQAEELCNLLRTLDRFIMFGDFNTVCKSVSDEEYTTIMKQFVDVGFHVANCSAQFGFKDTWTSGKTASGTWYPCDHIITSANIGMANVRVDTTKVTDSIDDTIDHIPLVAEVTI